MEVVAVWATSVIVYLEDRVRKTLQRIDDGKDFIVISANERPLKPTSNDVRRSRRFLGYRMVPHSRLGP